MSLYLYTLKIPENHWVSDVFGGIEIKHWFNQITNNISMEYSPILSQYSISLHTEVIKKLWFSHVLGYGNGTFA